MVAERMSHLGEAHRASGVAEAEPEPEAAHRQVDFPQDETVIEEVPQQQEEAAQEQDAAMHVQAEAEEAMDERALQDENREEAEREALVVAA
jgi:hypothetical protein